MAEKDYYKILGIGKSATKEDIKAAYKKLAKQYHPDISKESNASEKFKEINEAAAVLGDEQKRKQYDQFGSSGPQFESSNGFSGFDFSDFMSGSDFDFGNIFDSFFGGRRERRRQKGSDLRYDMEISLEDAAFGNSKTITIPRNEECEKCRGTGAEKPSDIVTCPDCHGKGTTTRNQRTPFGMFSSTSTCSTCRGQGKAIRNECPECDGNGFVRKTRKIDVKIPQGADDGTNLRIAGGGEAGERGQDSGDLYIVLHVMEHEKFERHGSDLYIKMPIPFAVAAIGGKIDVPTLKGKAELRIPQGTQSNTVLRMKGQGMPQIQSHHIGDQNVEVIIQVPEKLTKKQKKLLEEFEKESGEKGFLENMFS